MSEHSAGPLSSPPPPSSDRQSQQLATLRDVIRVYEMSSMRQQVQATERELYLGSRLYPMAMFTLKVVNQFAGTRQGHQPLHLRPLAIGHQNNFGAMEHARITADPRQHGAARPFVIGRKQANVAVHHFLCVWTFLYRVLAIKINASSGVAICC